MNEEWIGQQFGNYRLTRLLGQGGFAKVYLGEHRVLPLKVAIKILSTLVNDNAQQSFQREAQTIAELQHLHIVRVLDYDVQHGMPFLVMDYAPGGSLRHRYPKGSRLPLSLILAYMKQVALALQYAHNHRIIHRDVKPENILLGNNDAVLLSDFGIAIMRDKTDPGKQTVAGTVSYMAPEQLKGQPCAQSDQYALGIVVYELICGILPFRGSSAAVGMQHILTSPPSLRQYIPNISQQVEQVILTALQKDPDQRFPTVEAFATALETALAPSFRTLTPEFLGRRVSRFSNELTLPHQPDAQFVFGQPYGDDGVHPALKTKNTKTSKILSSETQKISLEELYLQLKIKSNPYMGMLFVQATADQQGVIFKLVDMCFWNLSPETMMYFPGTKSEEIRAYSNARGETIYAAIFLNVLPAHYVVWNTETHQKKTVIIAENTACVTPFDTW